LIKIGLIQAKNRYATSICEQIKHQPEVLLESEAKQSPKIAVAGIYGIMYTVPERSSLVYILPACR
jgi:hypothetical protein